MSNSYILGIFRHYADLTCKRLFARMLKVRSSTVMALEGQTYIQLHSNT